MALGKKEKKSFVVVQDGSQTSLTHKARSRRIRMEWYESHELFRLVDEPESALHPLHPLDLFQTIHRVAPGGGGGSRPAEHGAGSRLARGRIRCPDAVPGDPFVKLARPNGRSTTSPVETAAPEKAAPKDALEQQLAEEWPRLDKLSDSLSDVGRRNPSQLNAAIGAPTLAGSTDLSTWCTAAVAFCFGDRGTPGGANIVCPVR